MIANVIAVFPFAPTNYSTFKLPQLAKREKTKREVTN